MVAPFEPLLLPAPQQVEPRSDALALGAVLRLEDRSGEGHSQAALERLEAVLETRDLALDRDGTAGDAPGLRLDLDPAAGPEPEAYELAVDSEGVRLSASTNAGLSHALSTLAQWIRLHLHSGSDSRELPGVEMHDRPSIPHRGVLLDISRSRVPTMETLFELVDLMAAWKLNQLQLYTEHTFAYRGHETVWRDASPMTPGEIRRLDDFCRRRHVELVPNQNSCGHFHRWLMHERYRHLAECPDGIEHPFSRRREPFGLCTTDPAALELLEDLYDQLLPCFSSRLFHVGLDETIDLGRCRSRHAAERLGEAELYRRFLCEVHRRVTARGRRMQFWGDIVADHPDILAGIPDEAIIMEWGYEAGHDFDTRAAGLTAAGREFYLCPGTSSWSSFAGRFDNARQNIGAAVRAAGRHRAAGILVTDWGDHGHLQPLPASLPGLLLAAAFGWNADAAHRPETTQVAEILALHVLPERSAQPRRAAERLVTLADLYRIAGGRSFNASPLFYLLVRPDLPLSDRRLQGLARHDLQRCLEALEEIPGGVSAEPGGQLLDREIAWIRDALAAGARVGLARLEGALGADDALLAAIDSLIVRHGELWRARSRSGGLAESRAHLERARRRIAVPG